MPPTPTMQPPTLPPQDWPLVAEALARLGEPWPPELAAQDLAWLLWEHATGKRARAPGRPFLAARWNRSGDFARGILEAHQPSANPAPGGRQVGASSPTDQPGLTTDPRQVGASPAPAQRQEDTSPAAPELGGLGGRQPGASSPTGERREVPDTRQPGARPEVPITTTTSPHTRIQDPGSVVGEVQEGARPPELGAEARKFLELYTRWAGDPAAPKRWRTPAPEALAWFLSEILGAPEVVKGINVLGTLERWGDWLALRAEAHGKPGTAEGARFPDNWKNALRNWFSNARRYKPKAAPGAPAERRGAYKGAPTTPSLFRPTPPPGAPDDFNDWPDR